MLLSIFTQATLGDNAKETSHLYKLMTMYLLALKTQLHEGGEWSWRVRTMMVSLFWRQMLLFYTL